jgi:thymidylate synthase ThyX
MFYMTGNLWNFMHFMKLRLAKDHAQKEVVEYAQAMYDLLEPLVPEALAAFDDYHRNSVTFSAKEHTMLLRAMKNQGKFDPEDVTRFLGTEREADEFLRKIGER